MLQRRNPYDMLGELRMSDGTREMRGGQATAAYVTAAGRSQSVVDRIPMTRTMDHCAARGDSHPRRVALIGAPYAALINGRGLNTVIGALMVALLADTFLHVRMVPLATVAIFAYLAAIPFSRRAARKRLASFPDRPGNEDLVCFGNAEDLAPLVHLDSYSREPYVVQQQDCRHGRAQVYVALVIVAGMAATSTAIAGMWRKDMALVIVLACWPVLMFVTSYVAPVYYRVVPQRIDILEFGLFGKGVRRRTSVSLRDASVECHFKKHTLSITSACGEKQRVVIPFGGVRDARRFVRAVFSAALSQATAPPLPDNELLG